jgi:hypothetical protein
MEWDPVLSNLCKELKNKAVNEKVLGSNYERHHLEYIRGKWEAKHISILVLSKVGAANENLALRLLR